jgi:UDP-3-O-[3-hydroxymyristoyl] N-acetylglucosamine deacetylase / 3-hydroxyacyl-[acyl-carrier-protein] dehydratase
MTLQKTINKPVTVSGTGLHTGAIVNLTFKPAPVNHGFVFKRIDLDGHPEVEASVENVSSTDRGTCIEKDGVMIYTIEHALSALTGMDVDNCLLEIDGPEMPIKDGSAKFFVEAIKQSGILEQDAERTYYEIDKVLTWSDPENKIELIALPAKEYKLSVMIDFNTRVLSTQNAQLDCIQDFASEIASCRTFVFLHELEYLLNNSLIKGGDLSNAIVFVNKVVSQEELDRLAGLFNKPKVEVKTEGILNNLDLYFNNEPARHKLLDVIGDLTLAGKRIKGHIIASKPGHAANVEFAKVIKKHFNKTGENDVPVYDPNKEPLYDVNGIMKFLPHRPPFLFVDKIMEMSQTDVVGVKSVTMNEGFFVGHFPGEPVMPGVLQIEAMAQVGGVLALNTVPDPENYLTLFLKIEEVKFRNKVVPGDTLIFKLTLINPIRRGLVYMKGTAYVGKRVVMEARMLARLVKKD